MVGTPSIVVSFFGLKRGFCISFNRWLFHSYDGTCDYGNNTCNDQGCSYHVVTVAVLMVF